MLKNIASETEYETPSPIRTVIGMDFDNASKTFNSTLKHLDSNNNITD